MIVARRIAIIDCISALRGFVIAFLLLCPNWIATQGNPVSLKHLAIAQDRQFSLRFFDENSIDRRPGRQHLLVVVHEKEDCSRADYQENSEENFCAHRKDVRTTVTKCTKWNGFGLRSGCVLGGRRARPKRFALTYDSNNLAGISVSAWRDLEGKRREFFSLFGASH